MQYIQWSIEHYDLPMQNVWQKIEKRKVEWQKVETYFDFSSLNHSNVTKELFEGRP